MRLIYSYSFENESGMVKRCVVTHPRHESDGKGKFCLVHKLNEGDFLSEPDPG